MKRHDSIQVRLMKLRRMILVLALGCLLLLGSLLAFVPVDEKVRAVGTVRPEVDTYLYAPLEGLIEEIRVREGDRVEAGQILFVLDSHEFVERLAQVDGEIGEAEAELALRRAQLERTTKMPLPQALWSAWDELATAEETLRQSEGSLGRFELLFEDGLVSKEELVRRQVDREQAALEVKRARQRVDLLEDGLEESIVEETVAAMNAAAARVNRLKGERELLQRNIDRCHIRAPREGVLTYLAKRRSGQRVERGEKLGHLSHGEPSRADLFVGETQIHRVQKGQRVIMRSGVFDNIRYGYIEGQVAEVGMEALPRAVEDPPQFWVRAEIEKTPVTLALGSSVEAEIILRRTPLWRLLLPVRDEY